MKNKNLNFSPKTLQTSSGNFVAFPYELLNVADVIIMHSVEKTVSTNLCSAFNFSLGDLWYFAKREGHLINARD